MLWAHALQAAQDLPAAQYDDGALLEPLLAPVEGLTPGASGAALPLLLCEPGQQQERQGRRQRREWVGPGYWQSYACMVRRQMGGCLRPCCSGCRACAGTVDGSQAAAVPRIPPPPAPPAQAAWLAVLLCGYGVQRAACQVGLPYDGLQQVGGRFLSLTPEISTRQACRNMPAPFPACMLAHLHGGPICLIAPHMRTRSPPQISYFEVFSDVSSIALHGAVLGWVVGITSPRRFRWLASWRRWYTWATFFGTPPVYSAIRWGRGSSWC